MKQRIKNFLLYGGETSDPFKRVAAKVEQIGGPIAIIGLLAAAYCIWFFSTYPAALIKVLENLKSSQ